jgi:hypothetical protein
MSNLKLITMKILILSMVAIERKTIIVTMATEQPHFASSKEKRKKIGFSSSIISCKQGAK